MQSREAMRWANPEVMMTGECLSEVLMDWFDGLLLSVDQGRAGQVPAFQAVYHDDFVLFGNLCQRSIPALSRYALQVKAE